VKSNVRIIAPFFDYVFHLFAYDNGLLHMQMADDVLHMQILQVVLKMAALGPAGYWQSRRNRFDMFVTILGVIWIFLHFALKAVNVFSMVICFFEKYIGVWYRDGAGNIFSLIQMC